MSLPNPRLLRLLPGIVLSVLACSVAHAQIREEKPGPGLEEGVLLDVSGGTLASTRMLKEPVGDKDFSIVLDVTTQNLTDAVLYTDGDWGIGWGLQLKADGAVEFSGRATTSIKTPPRVVKSNARACIVASIRRNARQPESGIWVNGIESASGAVAPIAAGGIFAWQCESGKVASINIRVYNRALTRPEILELTLRGSGTASDKPKPKHPAPPPNGPRFVPQPDETIALIGGTEAVALAESAELEALLLMAFPQTKFHFRSLAWEGDTVFRQDRPMNFGSLEQQLRRVNAGAVFVMFGRQECLDAATQQGAGLAKSRHDSKAGTWQVPLLEFKAAFGKLLDTVEKVTPNIVVIGPPLFEKKEPPLPNLDPLSIVLKDTYNEAMRDCAGSRQALFADVCWEFCARSEGHGWRGYTNDANLLNSDGCRYVSEAVMNDLRIPQPATFQVLSTDTSRETGLVTRRGRINEELIDLMGTVRKSLAAKNRLWHNYWRPSNWAFLHGDRTNQPSSRDPVNPQVRLFPAEQEKYLPLIKKAEDKVFQLVQEAQKKVP